MTIGTHKNSGIVRKGGTAFVLFVKYNGILSCNKSVYKRDYYGRQHIAHLEFLAEGKVNTNLQSTYRQILG